MRTLVIPDVHEQPDKLEKLRPLIAKAEAIVSLGDWPDKFGLPNTAETLAFIKEFMDDPKWTWLIGNHDAHYMFQHRYFQCSGYYPEMKEAWHANLPLDFQKQWKIWHETEGFLLSHAGFNKQTIQLKTPEEHQAALDNAWAGGFHPLWMPGQDVGGLTGFVGGPNWMRWWRIENVESYEQIVGHTPQSEPEWKGHNLNLDTHLNHVAWINEGDVEIVTL